MFLLKVITICIISFAAGFFDAMFRDIGIIWVGNFMFLLIGIAISQIFMN